MVKIFTRSIRYILYLKYFVDVSRETYQGIVVVRLVGKRLGVDLVYHSIVVGPCDLEDATDGILSEEVISDKE